MFLLALKKYLAAVLLGTIIILGGYLRLSGIIPGYPPYHSDEGITYSAAVSMLENENFDPMRYDYPAVVPLTNLFFYKLIFIPLSWAKFYITHIPDILEGTLRLPLSATDYGRVFKLEILGEREIHALWWGRYTTAILGIGVIILSYINTKKLFDTKAALLVSLLVATNYRQVLNSHLGLPDIYNAFYLLLSLYMTLRLWEKPSTRNYVVASIFGGISLATKYQFFALIPLLIVHLVLGSQRKSWRERLTFLFNKNALAVPFIVLLVFILINPFLFINFEETKEWLVQVAGKYRTGRNELDIFSFSYLYHIGLGQVTSLLVMTAILVSFLYRKRIQILLLLSVVVSFFFITSFYTGGGFYTRNFVTITPVLLMFVGGLYYHFNQINKSFKWLLIALLVGVSSFSVWENAGHAIVVAKEYSNPWNIVLLQDWQKENLMPGMRVAAHSSVPLPKDVERLPFDVAPAFTLQEFMEQKSDYAVANLDWTTNDFYWWMTQDVAGGIKYWNKPVEVMEKSFSALAMRELSDFAVVHFFNPWQAYESNFIVSKMPSFEVTNKQLMISLIDEQSTLQKRPWISEPLDLTSYEAIHIEAKVQRQSLNKDRDGFLWIKFYEDYEEAMAEQQVLAVRMSSRQLENNKWTAKTISSLIPPDARFATVGYQAYNWENAEYMIKNLVVYNASVKQFLDGVELQPVAIPDDVLYPNSHGGL